jgi:hypothetical protein
MATDDGIDLDFLDQITNVQWESGLAVEFGKKAEDAPGSGRMRTNELPATSLKSHGR